MKAYHATISSPVGNLYAAGTARGISFLSFSRQDRAKYLNVLKTRSKVELEKNDPVFSPLKKALRRYFAGQKMEFTVPFDLFRGTPFQKRVWNAMRKIPYGETRSYKWLARRIGSSTKARAVGQACGSNPLPILIPCHRVIREDGGLGGFGGGLHIKRKLLEIESKK
ncbi:hypothetical protein AMJ44_06045 [candidate division WOR-1 bacterium DG_54_3]|uniref:Methylated-DNA--protein-cysteine methyltransferase n=1 Tax=candidate division WOR-1 bacterium DG_54_3 TaxID=1703775 RepID=A0A0S7Y224_UNCSA|nr:MAG: hypothetical protein AMJ44_06045 [candidate division WOR-1 bacterium DG_54_3]